VTKIRKPTSDRRESVYEAPRLALFQDKPKPGLPPLARQEFAFVGWLNHVLAPNFETAKEVMMILYF
jgi:gamma-glutamyl:cysteine ligase YbdK (ATP-grasp superfamily)